MHRFKIAAVFATGIIFSSATVLSGCNIVNNINSLFSEKSFSSVADSVAPESILTSGNTFDSVNNCDRSILKNYIKLAFDKAAADYFDKIYQQYSYRDSPDFIGYTVTAENYNNSPVYYLEGERIQEGKDFYYYSVHLYYKNYNSKNNANETVTVNRYLITIPDMRVIPMLDKNGEFVEEYNDIII